MKLKELRQTLEEMRKNNPEADEAEVRVNVEHSVVDIQRIGYFLEKRLIVFFPVGMLHGTISPTREEWASMKKQANGV